MAVPITSFLSKASPAIPFLIKDTDMRGGYRVVATEADRDAIHVGARTSGMLVFVSGTSAFFQWDGAAWQPFDVTSMVSIGTGLTVADSKIVIDTAHLDTLYAAAGHTHTEYAPVDHNHDSLYAAATHNHDTEYAAANHTHTEYAAANHTHTEYAAVDHNHDTQYAALNHDHSGEYASVSHTHSFASLTEVPKVTAMPGVTISTVEPGPTEGEDGDLWFVIAP